MFLITGATGRLGGAVTRQLLTRVDPAEVAVLARDEAKAADLAAAGVSVRLGDYDDAGAVQAAMAGVHRVLLVAGNTPGRRIAQHQNVIDAAAKAGVELFAFASRALRDVTSSVNSLMAEYFDTEQRIRQSGLPYAFFRNALYLDTLPAYTGGRAGLESGQLRLPTGDGTVAFALRREMGEAIGNALASGARQPQIRIIAAPRVYSMRDVADALTVVSGRPIEYVPVCDEEYLADVMAAGTPEARARSILGFYSDIRGDQLSQTSQDLQDLLGRPPAALGAGLQEVFGL